MSSQRAKTIITEISIKQSKMIELKFKIDDRFSDALIITLPYEIALSVTTLASIGVMGTFILSKLCLAENIILNFSCSREMVDSALSILKLLYNARCYRDRRALLPLPNIQLKKEIAQLESPPITYSKNLKNVYLLWSGGKDSTLSLLLLRENRYKVTTIHATANDATIQEEKSAVVRLGQLLDQKNLIMGISSNVFVKIGRVYSPTFDIFPDYNSIPHGRDFLLLTLLSALSLPNGAIAVCSGSEFELYSKVVNFNGEPIYKHDAQSEMGYRLITEWLQRWHNKNLIAFSPVSSLTEFRSFKILLEQFPDIFKAISSCFWEEWCGQCFKCFRYSLLLEFFNKRFINFQVHPFEKGPFIEKYMQNWDNQDLSYWQQIHYCLSSLSQRSEIIKRFPRLLEYSEDILPKTSPLLQDSYDSYLMKTHHTDLTLPGFNPDILS